MLEQTSVVRIPCRTDQGVDVGHFDIYDMDAEPSICIVPPASGGNGPPLVKILEERRYEFAFWSTGLRDNLHVVFDPPIKPSRIQGAPNSGRIETGRYVGMVELKIASTAGHTVARAIVEVQSRKLEYDSEFFSMMDELCSFALDTALSAASPASLTVATDLDRIAHSGLQRLFFLKAIFERCELPLALARLLRAPHAILREEEHDEEIALAASRIDIADDDLRSAEDRYLIPKTHPLAARLGSLPRRLVIAETIETFDTAENRFVKFVLGYFLDFIRSVSQAFALHDVRAAPSLNEWMRDTETYLAETLSHDFFAEVGAMKFMPKGSPVLQRKQGYRQLLDAWSKFDAALTTQWGDLESTFHAGVRDAAALYEIWCFFCLREALMGAFPINAVEERFLQATASGLIIQLASGNTPAILLAAEVATRRIRIKVFYRRSFRPRLKSVDGRIHLPRVRSETWSKAMDPDFSLAIWEEGSGPDFGEGDAIESGRIRYIHLDAKYRFTEAQARKGQEDEVAPAERKHQPDDLDKMHAYLAAITNSVAAIILFPGKVDVLYMDGGSPTRLVGAIALRPNTASSDKEKLRQFFYETVSTVAAEL